MFTHATIGSNDLERARGFHDATCTALGGKPGEREARGRLISAHDGGRLLITKPIAAIRRLRQDYQCCCGKSAYIPAWHEVGATNGGTAFEGSPSEHPNRSFADCLRDPDGSKRTARCPAAK
ncbi:hypothetical protein [Methylorubrum extorquens]|uniref:hypothetical protein n=1 Tax=Methylorubrum extorquens TaxID=408 RepID=UPI00016295B8|nr:hypothetical protein [Methylorubrum extorquens]ABY28929.1 conserved hypothetical protein [Methylorubrum extorquens PA1]